VRVTVGLSPKSLADKSSHGKPAVSVHTTVHLDGRSLTSSSARTFTVTLSPSQFGVGNNTLSLLTTAGGTGVVPTHASRTLHFSRCMPRAQFTG
jgi:hypothetical protein